MGGNGIVLTDSSAASALCSAASTLQLYRDTTLSILIFGPCAQCASSKPSLCKARGTIIGRGGAVLPFNTVSCSGSSALIVQEFSLYDWEPWTKACNDIDVDSLSSNNCLIKLRSHPHWDRLSPSSGPTFDPTSDPSSPPSAASTASTTNQGHASSTRRQLVVNPIPLGMLQPPQQR